MVWVHKGQVPHFYFCFFFLGKTIKKRKKKIPSEVKMKLNNLLRVVLSLMQNIGCHKHAFYLVLRSTAR